MNELNKLVKRSLVKYSSKDEYIRENNIDPMDWKEWKEQGYSDDGFLHIMDCYWLAGNATTGDMATIDNINDITDLLIEEMEASDFRDTIEALNEDNPENKIDLDSISECLEAYLEYCYEVSIFKQTEGKYKNHYCLVISED